MNKTELFGRIEKQKDEMVNTIMELVRIPSVTGEEREAQEFMEELYSDLGLKTQRVHPKIEDIRNHPSFIDTKESYEDRFNVVASLEGDPSKKSLIINGHIDIVSPEPIESWKYDPFEPTLEGNRLYGRGAGDMKAGLAANYYALKAILDSGQRPRGSVYLHSVIDEEPGGAGGTLSLLNQGHTADALLVTEPHNLQVTVSHAGILYFKIKVLGKSAHGGLAHHGINAIGKMIPIYQALERLERERAINIRFPLYEKGSGQSCHLAISSLTAGDWPGKVAGHAEMKCRISFIPGETKADVQAMVSNLVAEVASRDEWLRENPPLVEWFGWQNDPWYQDPSHPFIAQLQKAGQSVLGAPPEIIGRASGNDARFSQYFGMPGACIGPIAQNFHGADEWVDVDSVNELVKILSLFILEWTG